MVDHNRPDDGRLNDEVEQLEIERKLLNGVAIDPHGNIIRADWGVNLISRINRNSGGYGLGSAANPVIKATGYTDIVMFNPAISENKITGTVRSAIHLMVNKSWPLCMSSTSIVPTYSRSKGNFLYGLAVAATAVRLRLLGL